MKLPEITRQGHWHPDPGGVRLLARRRGVRVWRIEFEQKRPDVFSHGYELGGSGPGLVWNTKHHIWVGSREGSMLFREGEDGTDFTEFGIPLPWPGFNRQWRIYTDQEKWTVTIIALAEYDFLTSPRRVVQAMQADLKHWWKNRRKHDDHA